jgi:hypothetical protein
MKFIVYALLCPKCGCPRYVGQTQNWSSRLASHRRGIRSKDGCIHKKRWVQSLLNQGLEFGVVFLLELPTREGLPEAEIYWIKTLRGRGCPLTNLTDGGDGGTLGIKQSPETIAKRVAHVIGRPKSFETRAKISQTLTGRPSPKKGRPLSPEELIKHAEARAIPPFQDQYGRVYKTLKEDSERCGVSDSNICNVLKRKRRSTGGLVFTYVHDLASIAEQDRQYQASKEKSKLETKERNRARTRAWKEARQKASPALRSSRVEPQKADELWPATMKV